MSSDYVRSRVEAAGWAVRFVTDPALTVAGRVFPIANFGVARGDDLHGMLTVVFAGEAGDEAERWTGRGWAPEVSARRTLAERGWRLEAQVYSMARAREELTAALSTPALLSAEYGAWTALVERRGWVVDRAKSRDASSGLHDPPLCDPPMWQIKAAHPGEHLALSYGFAARPRSAHGELALDGFGGVVLATQYGPICAYVVALAPAVELLDAM